MDNRGIYLVIYIGPGQEDRANDPGYCWLPKGCCKFGQSLDLNNVTKRYADHCNGNVIVHKAGTFKDRDDIDAIEKKLHHRFNERRLLNRNNRRMEWMEPILMEELSSVFNEVIKEHFAISI